MVSATVGQTRGSGLLTGWRGMGLGGVVLTVSAALLAGPTALLGQNPGPSLQSAGSIGARAQVVAPHAVHASHQAIAWHDSIQAAGNAVEVAEVPVRWTVSSLARIDRELSAFGTAGDNVHGDRRVATREQHVRITIAYTAN